MSLRPGEVLCVTVPDVGFVTIGINPHDGARRKVREVRCHFDDDGMPTIMTLHMMDGSALVVPREDFIIVEGVTE